MNDYDNSRNEKEIREAIDAADNALYWLHEAQKQLRSAGNWGIVDMVGGGMLSTFIKRDKMQQARVSMENAKAALQSFNKEVRDVNQTMGLGFDMDFVGFADYFLDGFLVDFFVQGKIADARVQVEEAIGKVVDLRHDLESML